MTPEAELAFAGIVLGLVVGAVFVWLAYCMWSKGD